jgi:methylaspartate ammonia-lyase
MLSQHPLALLIQRAGGFCETIQLMLSQGARSSGIQTRTAFKQAGNRDTGADAAQLNSTAIRQV